MDLSTTVGDAVANLTTEVTAAFGTIAPLVLLIGGGFVAWKYTKRFLGKI